MRIVDLEGLAHQVVLEVEHGPVHIENRHIVHENRCTILLEGKVFRVTRLGDGKIILETGATSAIHGQAQGSGRITTRDGENALGGGGE